MLGGGLRKDAILTRAHTGSDPVSKAFEEGDSCQAATERHYAGATAEFMTSADGKFSRLSGPFFALELTGYGKDRIAHRLGCVCDGVEFPAIACRRYSAEFDAGNNIKQQRGHCQ